MRDQLRFSGEKRHTEWTFRAAQTCIQGHQSIQRTGFRSFRHGISKRSRLFVSSVPVALSFIWSPVDSWFFFCFIEYQRELARRSVGRSERRTERGEQASAALNTKIDSSACGVSPHRLSMYAFTLLCVCVCLLASVGKCCSVFRKIYHFFLCVVFFSQTKIEFHAFWLRERPAMDVEEKKFKIEIMLLRCRRRRKAA
jgi:hypothetical protein